MIHFRHSSTLLLFWLSIIISSVSAYADLECAQLLMLQSEIEGAAKSYKMHDVSTFRGAEHSHTISSSQENAVAISLGSGPDIFRPLVDFPYVKQVHLVDILTGWGSGPGEIVFEIGRRLKEIHPSAVVEIVDSGFTGKVDNKKLSAPEGVKEWGPGTETNLRAHFSFPESFWEGWYADQSFRSPLIWRVTWESESSGKQSKLVFLHPLDFHKEEHIDELFVSIGTMSVSGVLITGIGPPKNIERFTERLTPGKGVIVFEDFVRNGEREKLLDKLEGLGLEVRSVESDPEFQAEIKRYPGSPDLTTYLILRN